MSVIEVLSVHEELVARNKTAVRDVMNHLANPSQVPPSGHKELMELLSQVPMLSRSPIRDDAADAKKALCEVIARVDPCSGETLLSHAIEQKRVDAAYALVGAGSDVNGLQSTALGKASPLVLAVAGLPATAPIIPLLIAAGADADAALPSVVAAFCALPTSLPIHVLDQALATVIGAASPAVLSVAAKVAPLLEAAARSDAPDVFFALVARMHAFKPAAADVDAASIAEATADAAAAIAAAVVPDNAAPGASAPASTAPAPAPIPTITTADESKISHDAGSDFSLPFAASATVPGRAESAARWAAAATRHTAPRLRLQRKFAVAALAPALVAMARAANAPALVAASELYTGGCWAAVDAADADRHNAAGAVVEEIRGTSGAMIPGEMSSAAAIMDALIGAPATPRRTAAALAFFTHGPLRAPLPSCPRRAGFISPYVAAQRTGDAVATGNAQLVAAVARIACARRRIDSDNDLVPSGLFPLHLAVRARDPALLHALLVPGAVLSGSPAAVAAALATLRTHLGAATSPAAHDASAAYQELLSSGQHALVTKLYRTLGTVNVVDSKPLLDAVRDDDLTGVRLLLALGADARSRSVLSYAAFNGSYGTFAALRAAGAPIQIDAVCLPFPADEEEEHEDRPEISAERRAAYAEAGVQRTTAQCLLKQWARGFIAHLSASKSVPARPLQRKRINAYRAILDAVLAVVPHPREVLETLSEGTTLVLGLATGPFTQVLARRYGPEFALRPDFITGLVAGEHGAALGACLAMRSTRDALRALSPEQVAEPSSALSKDDADAIQATLDDPLGCIKTQGKYEFLKGTATIRGFQPMLSRLPPPKNGVYTPLLAPPASAGEFEVCLAERQHNPGSGDFEKLKAILRPGCRPGTLRAIPVDETPAGGTSAGGTQRTMSTLVKWSMGCGFGPDMITESLRPSPEHSLEKNKPAALLLHLAGKLPTASFRGAMEAYEVSLDGPEVFRQLTSTHLWTCGAARARMLLQRMSPATREKLRTDSAKSWIGEASAIGVVAFEAYYTALEQLEAVERDAPDHVFTVPRSMSQHRSFLTVRSFGLSSVARYRMM
jgi:hypothetical protein